MDAAVKTPPHPGEILREAHLAPSGWTVTAAAAALGVSRQSLSELLNARNGISADMAIRLAKAFPDTNIRYWLELQLQFDAWQAEQRADQIQVRRFVPPGRSNASGTPGKPISATLRDLKQRGAGKPAPAEVAHLYQQAFTEFGPLMLWSRKPSAHPTIAQALAVAEALRNEGNMKSRPFAARIEAACRAAL